MWEETGVWEMGEGLLHPSRPREGRGAGRLERSRGRGLRPWRGGGGREGSVSAPDFAR